MKSLKGSKKSPNLERRLLSWLTEGHSAADIPSILRVNKDFRKSFINDALIFFNKWSTNVAIMGVHVVKKSG